MRCSAAIAHRLDQATEEQYGMRFSSFLTNRKRITQLSTSNCVSSVVLHFGPFMATYRPAEIPVILSFWKMTVDILPMVRFVAS